MSIIQSILKVIELLLFKVKYSDKTTSEELYNAVFLLAKNQGHVNQSGNMREIFFYSEQSLKKKRLLSGRKTSQNEGLEGGIQKKMVKKSPNTSQTDLTRPNLVEVLTSTMLELKEQIAILANKIEEINTLLYEMIHSSDQEFDKESFI